MPNDLAAHFPFSAPARLKRPPILHRRLNRCSQRLGGVQREIGIAQEFAGQQHQIGLALAHDRFACWGVVISPTAPVRIPVSRRMRAANGT